MHCPFCGTTMRMRDGWLSCPLGGGGVSEYVARELAAIATSPPRVAQDAQVMDTVGPWHCPADGQRMDVAAGRLPQCPQCDRVLPKELVYHLVELHSDLRLGHDTMRKRDRPMTGLRRLLARRHE